MINTCNYLIRLDDACPNMDKMKWKRIEDILDKYNIIPMVGIIPANMDPELLIDDYDSSFWNKARLWQSKGWSIALHGYDHLHLSNKGGVNPVHKRSEFAGLSLKEQEEKIGNGISILNKHNLDVKYFFAPSHTFDKDTIRALKNKSHIRRISDTIGRYPYMSNGMIFYPVQFGKLRKISFPGYWTFCIHPNNVDDLFFSDFETFLLNYQNRFISFNKIETSHLKQKSLFDNLLSTFYFIYRKFI